MLKYKISSAPNKSLILNAGLLHCITTVTTAAMKHQLFEKRKFNKNILSTYLPTLFFRPVTGNKHFYALIYK